MWQTVPFLFLFLLPSPALAVPPPCIKDPAHPPCGGAPGKCTLNQDGKVGGFVADTATRETKRHKRFWRYNRPYIAQYAQVCGQAKVLNYARLENFAVVQDRATVQGTAKVLENATIADDAVVQDQGIVRDRARISGNAKILEQAVVQENAEISGTASIKGTSCVRGNAKISGNALISGGEVFGEAKVFDQAKFLGGKLSDQAQIYGQAVVTGEVNGNARIYGNAQVTMTVKVLGQAQVFGNARLSDKTVVLGQAQIYGDAHLSGETKVSDSAKVYGKSQVKDALISGSAQVFENAIVATKDSWTTPASAKTQISGEAKVYGNAKLFEGAQVLKKASVYGNAEIRKASISDRAQVYGDAKICIESVPSPKRPCKVEVYDSARVSGNAELIESAKIYGNATVYGDATVRGMARIFEDATVLGASVVSGNAQIHGNAQVNPKKTQVLRGLGLTLINENADIYGDAILTRSTISGNAKVFENASVKNSFVKGSAQIYGSAAITDNSEIYGNAKVFDRAKIHESAEIYGNAQVYGDADVGAEPEQYDRDRSFENVKIYENAKIFGHSQIQKGARISGSTQVSGDATVGGDVTLCGNLNITRSLLGFNTRQAKRQILTFYKMEEVDRYHAPAVKAEKEAAEEKKQTAAAKIAKSRDCIKNSRIPPCGGAAGQCSINSDGSLGGFIADTAKVTILPSGKNQPYISPDAQVCDSAEVLDNAKLEDSAKVYGRAKVSGSAKISNFAQVFENASVSDNATVSGNAKIYGNAKLSKSANISGNMKIFGSAKVDSDLVTPHNLEISISDNYQVSFAQSQANDEKETEKIEAERKAYLAWAANLERCTKDPKYPPCGGAPGRCTENQDGTAGGFVAKTASVETVPRPRKRETAQDDVYFLFSHTIKNRDPDWFKHDYNKPYIARYAQICDQASVKGDVIIENSAKIYGHARVHEKARVSGNAEVFENAQVYGSAHIYGNAKISGDALVYGTSEVFDDAQVFGNTQIYENSRVFTRARVYGSAQVLGNAKISGGANALDRAVLFDSATLEGNAQALGTAEVGGNIRVSGNVVITQNIMTGKTSEMHISGSSQLSSAVALVEEDERVSKEIADPRKCTRDFSRPPCSGAPGKCTQNQDGSIGGFVASSATLEQIPQPRFVRVTQNRPFVAQFAQVCDKGQVLGTARLVDYAKVVDEATVSGMAVVSGEATVGGKSTVEHEARVYGKAQVSGSSRISGQVRVHENASIVGSTLRETCKIYGRAKIIDSTIEGSTEVFGDVQIRGEHLRVPLKISDAKTLNQAKAKNHSFEMAEKYRQTRANAQMQQLQKCYFTARVEQAKSLECSGLSSSSSSSSSLFYAAYKALYRFRNGDAAASDSLREHLSYLIKEGEVEHNPYALTLLGWLYSEGRILRADPKKSLQFYLLATIAGDPLAQGIVAIMYEYGTGGLGKNLQKAIYLHFESGMGGNPLSLSHLGIILAFKSNRPSSYAIGINFLQRAAIAGVPDAQNNLAWIYSNGHGTGRDYKLAVYWFKKVLESKNKTAELARRDANYNLGVLYEKGLGVPTNGNTAYTYYGEAMKSTPHHPGALRKFKTAIALQNQVHRGNR